MSLDQFIYFKEDSLSDFQAKLLLIEAGKILAGNISNELEFVTKASLQPKLSFNKTLENPSSAEDSSIGFTPVAITITDIRAVLVGSSTPSVTWTIRHSTDRSAAGNEVVTGGTTTTAITGSSITSFNDATIPANSYIWLETTAQSGTVNELFISAIYTED